MELFNKNQIQFNIDLIYGFEGQSVENFCDDLDQILKYGPAEITLYRFENQKRTDDRSIKVKRLDKKTTYTMQEAGRIILLKHGYTEGPDGWFTKNGAKKAKVYEDRWKKQIPLLGFGPEAYSYSKYQQHTNKTFQQYQEAVRENKEILDTNLTYEYIDSQVAIRRMVFDLKSKFETNFKTDHERFLFPCLTLD